VRNYKRYRVWQLAHALVPVVYELTEGLPSSERFGLASQMRRAAVSISSNIAEGAGRGSDADFARFLSIASGSANELESQFLALRTLGLLSVDETEEALDRVDHIRRQLIKLIKATK